MNSTHLSRRGTTVLVAGLLGLWWSSSLPAAEDPQTVLLAAACANCHGTDGVGAPPMLPLAGRPVELLIERLLAFKSGEADDTVMGRLARGYTDGELDALARHFASLDAEGSR